MTDVTKTCRDIDELLPAAQKACNLFLAECKKAGINIFITETYRSQSRQNYLYTLGRRGISGEKKVTWTKSSNHTGRLAWDIAVNPPKDLYDVATLKKAGAIAKKLNITWGGTWDPDNIDRPHFEVKSNWTAPKTSTAKKSAVKVAKSKINSVKIQTGGLTASRVKEVTEYLVEKGWFAEVTFSSDSNPKLLTGGLSPSMQKEFEAWLKERDWSYKVID